MMKTGILLVACSATLLTQVARADDDDDRRTSLPHSIPNMLRFVDPHGEFASYTLQGRIDTSNPFFQDLGTNGRRCVTCHQPNEAWTVTPEKNS